LRLFFTFAADFVNLNWKSSICGGKKPTQMLEKCINICGGKKPTQKTTFAADFVPRKCQAENATTLAADFVPRK
jgi:hypothetical protein